MIKFQGKAYIFYDPISDPLEITGNWKVDFIEGGPSLPPQKEVSELISWTGIGGEDVKNFSGTAKYSSVSKNPEAKLMPGN